MKPIRVALLLAALLCVGATSSAVARQWNPTPAAKANDYLQITDQRTPNEMVLVLWLAPQLIPPSPDAELTRKILEDDIVIGLAHADISDLGAFEFRKIREFSLMTFRGSLKFPVSVTALSPVLAGTIAALQQIFSQALGQLGQGMEWVVFDGKWNDSCGKDGFWVSYDGTDYDFQMPVPGC
jgi:hypothetical protein